MYTSKSGDLYIGQARALGAADILLKPPTRQSLQDVFDRLDSRERAQTPAATAGSVAANDAVVEPVVEIAVEESDEETVPRPAPLVTPAPEVVVQRSPSWLAMTAALLIGVAVGMAVPKLKDGDGLQWRTIEWAFSASPTFAYGEEPFGGERVALIRQLLSRLQAEGFRGTLVLEGHVGSFCVVSTGGRWVTPRSNLPIEGCELIGHRANEARRLSAMQSAEFRNLLDSSPLLRDIRVDLRPMGDATPRVQYPEQRNVRTAGDWNRIAASNNRIEVRLIPD